jgi:hypothetical protein
MELGPVVLYQSYTVSSYNITFKKLCFSVGPHTKTSMLYPTQINLISMRQAHCFQCSTLALVSILAPHTSHYILANAFLQRYSWKVIALQELNSSTCVYTANLRTNHKEHALGIASPFSPGTPDPDKLGHCQCPFYMLSLGPLLYL